MRCFAGWSGSMAANVRRFRCWPFCARSGRRSIPAMPPTACVSRPRSWCRRHEGRIMSADLIPISVLTGFLGSGKTTMLRHLLGQPEFARTAVIINEFGAVGIDHELVEASEDSFI